MMLTWAKATRPMPSTLPVTTWIGRTVEIRTLTMRFDCSSIAPTRIQPKYCESMMKIKMRPTNEVGSAARPFLSGCTLVIESGLARESFAI